MPLSFREYTNELDETAMLVIASSRQQVQNVHGITTSAKTTKEKNTSHLFLVESIAF